MATASCTLNQSLRRRLEDEAETTPPPKKKRPCLSLNKSRSSTPSRSSGGVSPCSSVASDSSTHLPTSCCSTPPLSPSSTRSKRKGSKPVKLKSLSPPVSPTISPAVSLTVELKESKLVPLGAEVLPISVNQPCTSKQAVASDDSDILETPILRQTTPPHVEATPSICTDSSPMEQSLRPSERVSPRDGDLQLDFHDISMWGGGRLAYSCDLPNCRPFDKFSQGHLENYAELISKGGDLENYLHTAERLINHGCFIPTSKLNEVFQVMWKCHSDYAVKKMHFFLQQDISLRTDTSMKSSRFWDMLRKCLEALSSNRQVLVASVQLTYLLSFLIKNLDANKLEPRSSLVEQLFSSKKTLNISAIFDVVFSLQAKPSNSNPSLVPVEPVHCLLAMICLPLLTCDPSSRPELRTKLAREFATRLDHLTSHTAQYQLISAIPSNYVKEKVLDFVLERNFTLCAQSTDVAFSDSSVSFAKITSVHLHRLPRHPDGSPQSLAFFLQLLTGMIHTHLMTVRGTSPLVSLLPSSPLRSMVNSSGPSVLMDTSEIREALLDMHSSVLLFTDRLLQDDQCFKEVTEPTTWFLLQLLSLITSVL